MRSFCSKLDGKNKELKFFCTNVLLNNKNQTTTLIRQIEQNHIIKSRCLARNQMAKKSIAPNQQIMTLQKPRSLIEKQWMRRHMYWDNQEKQYSTHSTMVCLFKLQLLASFVKWASQMKNWGLVRILQIIWEYKKLKFWNNRWIASRILKTYPTQSFL